MLFRALIVLPTYLALLYGAPYLEPFRQFAAVVRSSAEEHMTWHLAVYGGSLLLAVLCTWLIEYKNPWLLERASVRVLRIGLIGVVVTCVVQFFLIFTTNSFNIIIILIPVAFIVAEIIYESIEGARAMAAHNRRRAQQRRAERLNN